MATLRRGAPFLAIASHACVIKIPGPCMVFSHSAKRGDRYVYTQQFLRLPVAIETTDCSGPVGSVVLKVIQIVMSSWYDPRMRDKACRVLAYGEMLHPQDTKTC